MDNTATIYILWSKILLGIIYCSLLNSIPLGEVASCGQSLNRKPTCCLQYDTVGSRLRLFLSNCYFQVQECIFWLRLNAFPQTYTSELSLWHHIYVDFQSYCISLLKPPSFKMLIRRSEKRGRLVRGERTRRRFASCPETSSTSHVPLHKPEGSMSAWLCGSPMKLWVMPRSNWW